MIAPWVKEILRCPETLQELERAPSGWKRSSDGKYFPDQDGLTSLVYPLQLSGDDEKMSRLYEWIAPFYDASERILGRILTGVDMQQGRQKIIDLLPLKPGMRLLEVSPGPGVFQPMLRKRLGKNAEMAAVDLSINMLRQCGKQHASAQVELVHANALHLPFADNSFDILFHFGGVNLFNYPDLALREFVRVVRRGGIVSWGDEEMSASYAHPVGRHVLPRLNPGFQKIPPKSPVGVIGTTKHVVYDGLGYLVLATKA
jgi:ubiquinone/menaquinone biosynthesis C-methylase UbiE